ncbi:hypothetical protein ACRTEE_23290, partial [Vibrio alginolyticus]|uniref:hypothetical protein n=1 Tax=Vibrio alginolyticus TaxID=663 RepID=UPI003D7CEFEB
AVSSAASDVYKRQDIEVVSNFNVLDVKESLGKLDDVIYRGKSLNEYGQSLSVITLKLSLIHISEPTRL